MSSFIVEDKTINTVVTWLYREVIGSEGYYLGRSLNELGYFQCSEDWPEALANDMFKLNIEAVNARYGDGEAEKFRDLDFVYQKQYALSTVQVLKSLQCWLYQCSEGKVPNTKLYKFFDEVVEKHLLKKIVYALGEYDKAQWG